MEIRSVSEHAYVIKNINKKSRARYAKPYQVGDEITFSTTIFGDNGGNYVVRYALYKNGQEIATVTQNELVDMFAVFDVEIADKGEHHE